MICLKLLKYSQISFIHAIRFTLIILLVLPGCKEQATDRLNQDRMERQGTSNSDLLPFSCTPVQQAPYPNGIPYLGIHGDAGNSDMIDCQTAGSWTKGWHALRGLGMTQPNTFSPDGSVTYVTTTNSDPDGCRLYALDVKSGQYLWCRSEHTSIERSSVEVDEYGHLYFTVEEAVVSLTSDGVERWRTGLTDLEGNAAGGWGVHFTPQGHVATVTSSGRVYLLSRETGVPLATFDISSTWGFVPPETFGVELDPSSLLPVEVQTDIQSVWGGASNSEQSEGFGALLGSGKFVDNTVAISSEGDIYVIGGGPTPQEGAVVQIKLSMTDGQPQLTPGWYAVTSKGSATTPSLSKNDQYMVISDGAHPSTFLRPDQAYGEVKVFDIERCNTNQDSDPDPDRCAYLWSHPLERAPMVGAPAISSDGTVIYWEMGLAFDADPTASDVVAVNEEGIVWESALPDDMDWSSVVTVTRNHVIGSASKVTPSDQGLPGFKLPSQTVDRLVVLSRTTGELVWHHDLPDDSAATVTVGPDGSLYVPMLGIFSILAINERPTLGLVKFLPDLNAAPPPALFMLNESSDEVQEQPSDQPVETATEGEETEEPEGQSSPSMEWSGQCFEMNTAELPTCCETDQARCVPSETIPEGFGSLLSECEEEGLCVPESILRAEGSIAPATCASVGGTPGACLSTCLPSVAETAALLPQDSCQQGEVCVPCVSPLDGQDTGACGEISCQPTGDENDNVDRQEDQDTHAQDREEDQEPMNSGAAPACCGGEGVCLGAEVVPADQQQSVRSCRREGHRDLMCVPRDFVDPTWIPQACTGSGALGGSYEGVCLSSCLKLPFEFTLDREPCQPGYVCAPCFRPLSGEPTGAPGCSSP